MAYLTIVVTALDQGLQVGDDEAKRIQNDPGHNDSLQPAAVAHTGCVDIMAAVAMPTADQ